MKSLAIVLSLFLCAPAVFAAPEETRAAAGQTPGEAPKTSGKPSAHPATPNDAEPDAASNSEKTVSYRTPFGTVTRKESAEAAERPKAELPAWLLEIEEKGSSVTFKKKTPFGVTSYSKPKNDLTDEERDLLATYQAAKVDSSLLEEAKRPARPKMPIPKK